MPWTSGHGNSSGIIGNLLGRQRWHGFAYLSADPFGEQGMGEKALPVVGDRQTGEIGIRMALGADRRRIIRGVFSRAMFQIGTGIVIGSLVRFYVIVAVMGGGDKIGLFVMVAAVLLLVGAIACGVPIRRRCGSSLWRRCAG